MPAKLPLALTITTTALLTTGCHSSNDADTSKDGPIASATAGTTPEITQTTSAVHDGPHTSQEEKLAADAKRISSYSDEAVILRLSGTPATLPLTLNDTDAGKLVGFACIGPQNIRVEFLDANKNTVSKSNIACRSAFTVDITSKTSKISALRVKSIQGTITTVAVAGPISS